MKANTILNLLLSPTEPVVTIKPGPAVWICSACHDVETLDFIMGKLVCLLGVGKYNCPHGCVLFPDSLDESMPSTVLVWLHHICLPGTLNVSKLFHKAVSATMNKYCAWRNVHALEFFCTVFRYYVFFFLFISEFMYTHQ